LVWQDLLFACAAYAEEEPMRSLIEAEVRDNVTRLSKHPSLVLWNGCNENIWGWFDWGWQEKVGDRTWGAGYYFELFPKWIGELDPTRPYWPGSPFSGTMDIHPLADQWGNKHMWDTWNRVNHTNFRTYSPRFASEFGHQAPPTYATLARSIPKDQRDPFSPAMLHHQKATDGNDKLHARLREHFGMPEQFDDWLYLTQLMQARAMQTAVEWFRSRPVCSGALYWQINDCWPVTSWAAIDGDGREKPLYWASQRFFAPRLLTIQPDGTGYAIWAHNDTDKTWHGEVSLALLNVEGDCQRENQYFLHAAPRQLAKVAHLDSSWVPEDRTRNFLTAHTPGAERAFWFFVPDKKMRYPRSAGSAYEAELETLGEDRYALTVTAHTLLRDLCLFADRLGARSKGGYVTLLPGESFTFEIESTTPLVADQLIAPPVLQDATRFGI
jgi:beta-mannosidase